MENNINSSNSLDYKNEETIEENKNYNENLINTKNNFSFYQKYKIYIFIYFSLNNNYYFNNIFISISHKR